MICCAARRRSNSRAAALAGISPMPPARPGRTQSNGGRWQPSAGPLQRRRVATGARPLEPDRAPASRKSRQRCRHQRQAFRVEGSLDRVERRQSAALAQMQERYDGKARRLRGVLADLGLKLEGTARPASGGPFVPIKLPGEGNGFERALTRVNIARTQAEQLSHTPRLRAGAQTGDRRNRPQLDFRRARRSVSACPGDAYRHRFPRRRRRSDPRHRGRHRHRGRLERRLRQDGRDRSRQRPVDPLRPSVARSTSMSGTRFGSVRSSAAWARPAARPVRICTTRPASTAKRSIRKSSSMPAPGCTARAANRQHRARRMVISLISHARRLYITLSAHAAMSRLDMIRVHHLNNSRSQRVLWLLEELGIALRSGAL